MSDLIRPGGLQDYFRSTSKLGFADLRHGPGKKTQM